MNNHDSIFFGYFLYFQIQEYVSKFKSLKQIDIRPGSPNQRIKKIESEGPNKNSFRALFYIGSSPMIQQ
jgi:hypothetical protein